MSEGSCSKCGGEMIEGTAGVSALRIWYRPDKWSPKHSSFKLTSSHLDIVRAKACKSCGHLDFYVDTDHLDKFVS